MRVLVSGSRNWDLPDPIWACLSIIAQHAADAGESDLTVVHGACFPRRDPVTGRYPLESADYLAYLWTRRRDHVLPVVHEPHPAQWRQYRNGAGPVRNRAMAKLGADLALVFIRDDSPGSTDMLRAAEEHDIPTQVIDYVDVAEVQHAH